MKYIFSEFLDNFLNWDSKFFTTLRYLVLKPGFLSKEYIEGRRLSYVAPIRLYIVLSVVFFFIVSFIPSISSTENIGESDNVVSVTFGEAKKVEIQTSELKRMECEGTLDNYVDSITANTDAISSYFTRKSIYSNIDNSNFFSVMVNQLSMFLLLFVPLLALMYASTFSRNKRGFIGHLIFNFHLNSFVILLSIMVAIIAIFLNTLTQYIALGLLALLISQIYLLKAVGKFYERKWYVVAYKYLFLIVGYASLGLVFLVCVFLASLIAA